MPQRVPLIRQLDQMDCGPACLLMISKFFGRTLSRERVRELTEVSKEGVSFASLSEAAEQLGFRSMAVALPPEVFWSECPVPCIAHWEDRHFVIVERLTRTKVDVVDPLLGKVCYAKAAFLSSWLKNAGHLHAGKGLALVLEPSPEFLEGGSLASSAREPGFAFLLHYFRPHRQLIWQLALSLLAGSIISLFLPFVMQGVVDHGIASHDLSLVTSFIVAHLTLTVSMLLLQLIRGWLLLHIGSRVGIALISDFLRKLMRLPMMFFETRTAGDIIQRIEDHERINHFLGVRSLSVIFSLFNAVIFSAVLASYQFSVLIVLFAATLLSAGWMFLFMQTRRKLDFLGFEVQSNEQDRLYELIQGAQEIRIQGLGRSKRWEWESIAARRFKLKVRGLALQQLQTLGSFFFAQVSTVLITFLAARAVIQGEMSLGMMMATQYIVGQIAGPAGDVVQFLQDFQDAKISLERMTEIYEKEDERDYLESKPSTFPRDRTLRMEDVSFRYPSAKRNFAIRNLTLTIPDGKTTAIVGSSGSGKTTLLKLLLALHPPVSGRIFLGELLLADYDGRRWRQRCGVVMQDGYLFADTIERNIACAEGSICRKRLHRAIELAGLEDVLAAQALGLQTKVGATGTGLSGGERQRVLIARALYKEPEYLFMDEATSALDATRESEVLNHLSLITQGRTVVIIAHRLSTVRHADQIAVIDRGTVVELGTHQQLVDKQGRYFSLVSNQLDLERVC